MVRVSVYSAAVVAAALACANALPESEVVKNSRAFGTIDNNRDQDNIIGGTRAGTNEFPFMASVLSNGRQTCGGSIIGSNWILTAAHCVAAPDPASSGPGAYKPVLPSSLSVVVGTGTATSAAATAQFKVSRVIPHPQYDSSTMHQDIALLRLATPIKLSAGKAQQIGILTSSISDGDQLTLAGYGWVNNKGSTSSNLMKVGLTVGDVDTCQKGAGEYTDSNGIFVCTIPQDGESGCFGDSGGPLFLASSNGGFAQAGIVSFDANYITPSSRACASKGSVSFYTRVSNYIPWISQVTSISSGELAAGTGNSNGSEDNSPPPPPPPPADNTPGPVLQPGSDGGSLGRPVDAGKKPAPPAPSSAKPSTTSSASASASSSSSASDGSAPTNTPNSNDDGPVNPPDLQNQSQDKGKKSGEGSSNLPGKDNGALSSSILTSSAAGLGAVAILFTLF